MEFKIKTDQAVVKRHVRLIASGFIEGGFEGTQLEDIVLRATQIRYECSRKLVAAVLSEMAAEGSNP